MQLQYITKLPLSSRRECLSKMRVIAQTALLLGVVSATSVNLPSTPPSSAVTVDPSFPNIALEFASLVNFAQSKSCSVL